MKSNHLNPSINDSLLALIIRFIDSEKDINFCTNEFIQKQIENIQSYIAQFPAEEKNYRALVWIEQYAKTYRKQWENEIITRELRYQRCSDCPLMDISDNPCQIHQEWLNLLQRYIQEEINSRQYVEQTLSLLEKHKQVLKIRIPNHLGCEKNSE